MNVNNSTVADNMADVRTFDSFAALNAAIDELQVSDKVTFVRQTSTKNFSCDGAYCTGVCKRPPAPPEASVA